MKLLIYTYKWLSLAFRSWSSMMGLQTNCKFTVCCSDYALTQCADAGPSVSKQVVAFVRIVRRLVLCSPLFGLLSTAQRERF